MYYHYKLVPHAHCVVTAHTGITHCYNMFSSFVYELCFLFGCRRSCLPHIGGFVSTFALISDFLKQFKYKINSIVSARQEETGYRKPEAEGEKLLQLTKSLVKCSSEKQHGTVLKLLSPNRKTYLLPGEDRCGHAHSLTAQVHLRAAHVVDFTRRGDNHWSCTHTYTFTDEFRQTLTQIWFPQRPQTG